MEEKRRIAAEMKAFSKARLNWIKAINRVLIMNYIEAVKTRLLNSSYAEWYKILMAKAAAEEAAEAEKLALEEKIAQTEKEAIARQRAILAANSSSSKSSRSNPSNNDRAKNKVARRSLDNSQLPSLSNIDITNTNESSKVIYNNSNGNNTNVTSLPQLNSPSAKNLPEKLLLDPMERRRLAKAERMETTAANTAVSAKLSQLGKALSRKSFGGETESELLKYQSTLAPHNDGPTIQISASTSTLRPPSLLQSYSTKGSAMINISNIDTSESGKGPKLLESKSLPRRARA